MTKQEISFYDKPQTDNLLAAKANTADLATVAFTGDYDDLMDKPVIPAAQVNSDWNATSGVAEILNKPTIPAAQVNADWNATSGVAEILNKPTIPDVSGKLDKVTTSGQIRVYGVATDGTNMMLNVIEGAVQGSIPWRTTSGRVYVGTPVLDGQATTKKYVDDLIAGCLPAYTGTHYYPIVTSINPNGTWKYDNITVNVIPSSIVQRDGNGQMECATPTANNHAANKGYVDDAVSGITGTISITDNTDYITINY